MQNSLSEAAWPTTQYLWGLHPVFAWLGDKAGLLYNRGEAPLIALSGGMLENACLFIVAGTIPNRKSTPVIDEWFALLFKDGRFERELTMGDVLSMTKIRGGDLPNADAATPGMQESAIALLPNVVEIATGIMQRHCNDYKGRIDPHIDKELDKLAELQKRHMDYQMSLFEDEKRESEQKRKVDKMFDDYVEWVKDTLEIEDNPYIRIIAAIAGAGV
jgi:hypothetical protein